MISTKVLDAENRKGTILGLTMAEAVLLILFCLFLASMIMISKKHKEAIDIQRERDQALIKEQELEFLLNEIKPKQQPGEKIEDTFSRLYTPQEKAQQMEKLEEVRLAIEEAEKELENNPAGSSTILQIIKEFQESKEREENLKKEKQEIMAYYERQLTSGYGPPPCWIRDGKPVYTFHVTATTDGYVLNRINNPDFDSRPEAALADKVTTNFLIKESRFIAETAPMKAWADKHECVFYVSIEDNTKQHEKVLWKRRLNIVEGHFYKYLTTQ